MAQKIRDVMTANPLCLDVGDTVLDAARVMRSDEVGDVLVCQGGDLVGIVTDRDLVVRALADDDVVDARQQRLGPIASRDVLTLSADDDVEEAVQLMAGRAIRRVPVCDGPRPVGVVSIGDLAMDRDDRSVLAEISAAPANS
jgi:CBS domain-containing protein